LMAAFVPALPSASSTSNHSCRSFAPRRTHHRCSRNPGTNQPHTRRTHVRVACCLHPRFWRCKKNSGIRDFIPTVVMPSCNSRLLGDLPGLASFWQQEDLPRIDQVWVADLIAIRIEDERVLDAAAIGASSDPPETVPRLHDHKVPVFPQAADEVGADKGRFQSCQDRPSLIDLIQPELMQALRHQLLGFRTPAPLCIAN